VHRYAFASPLAEDSSDGDKFAAGIGVRPSSGTARKWRVFKVADSGYAPYWEGSWDYLTASGDPHIWVVVDARGEILEMWEAEDPVDAEFPEDPALEPEELPQGMAVVPVRAPKADLLAWVMQRLANTPLPSWHGRSVYKTIQHPGQVQRTMLLRWLASRGLEVPGDIRDVYGGISDEQRRHWYLQLWLRAASRILCDSRMESLIPLYKAAFRVDSRTGVLELQ